MENVTEKDAGAASDDEKMQEEKRKEAIESAALAVVDTLAAHKVALYDVPDVFSRSHGILWESPVTAAAKDAPAEGENADTGEEPPSEGEAACVRRKDLGS